MEGSPTVSCGVEVVLEQLESLERELEEEEQVEKENRKRAISSDSQIKTTAPVKGRAR
jgi:hypothetical protein